MDLQEFLSWLDTEFSKYSVLAKSNPRSLNELVYVLRRTDRDFSINWETVGGFASIPTIREAFIPSRDLAMKVEVIGYDEDSFDGKTYCSITVNALDGPCANGVIYPSSMKCNGDDTAESKVFTIGGSVLANGNSDFCGLCGRVTEIRDGEDKETENEGADIYCDFDKPGKDHMIAEIETRFSKLYQMPKRIDELPLDGVIMAAEMLEPVADALPTARESCMSCSTPTMESATTSSVYSRYLRIVRYSCAGCLMIWRISRKKRATKPCFRTPANTTIEHPSRLSPLPSRSRASRWTTSSLRCLPTVARKKVWRHEPA